MTTEAERDRHGPCICNYGPGTEGPDEFCPRHGRTYDDLLAQWQADYERLTEAGRAAEQRLADLTKAIRDLADGWESKAPRLIDGPENPWWSIPIRDAYLAVRALLTEDGA